MNYIKQLNEFYSTLDYKPVPSNSIALYFILLQVANKTGWIDKFKVANTTLMSKCDLNMQKLIRARNNLINQGYIKYFKGKNQTDAPTYSIVKLYNDIADDTADNISNDIANNIAGNIANDTINKQNKTKLNKENIKRKYGEYQNVFFTDKQYEELMNTFPNDYQERIQKLDDYIQSTGKKYKDCLATIKNWARKDGYDFKKAKKQEAKNEEELCFNANDLTEEQYVLYMQGKLGKEDIRKILEAKNV